MEKDRILKMEKRQRVPSTRAFIIQSALLWSCVPLLYSFLPVYLSGIGFHESRIGIIMALGPLMAAVLQPFIGVAVDRSNLKNTILMLLTGGSVISILLFPLNKVYLYVLIISIILAAFQSALTSTSETITLESLDAMKKPYGPVRAFGTIGYSLVSIIVGILMKWDIRNIFYVTAIIGLLGMVSVSFLPKVRGHQSEGNHIAIKELFQDKLLIVFMLFSMMAQLAISFYQTFFPIYFASIGGTEGQLGVLYFIMAICELPFLLLSGKIIKKLGIQLTLVLSMGVIAVRFILLYLIKSPLWIYPVSMLHGLTFIVFSFSLAVYINKTAKKELRATGQTIHGFISMGLGRILGSVLGGFLIEGFGLLNVMLFAFALCVVSIVFFIAFCAVIRRTPGSKLPVYSD